MKQFCFLFFLLLSKFAFSCKCATIEPITKEACDKYDVIFYGYVDSVTACNHEQSTASFNIIELYKGNTNQKIFIEFDCASSCLMSFAKGEKWLIYANYKRFDLLQVSLCSNSRKWFDDESQDFYQLQAQRTFKQETEFLKSELGTQAFNTDNTAIEHTNEIAARNEQPSAFGKLALLGISLLVMIGIFYFTRKTK